MNAEKRLGAHTIRLASPVAVLASGCAAGRKEGQGPLRAAVDTLYDDDLIGQDSWEKAESHMQREALNQALKKASAELSAMDMVFAGDLLNQCAGSTFGLRESGVPFYGLYGACSTMAESISLAAICIDGGFAARAAAVTSSHYCSAERQYRLPLDYGAQRAPTAQWTVTGAGAALLGTRGPGPFITHIATGKIVDAGITDAANMGAAMAPAAYDTLSAFFSETGLGPEAHDLIVTGDLGSVGSQIVRDLFLSDGVDLAGRYNDCGTMIFDCAAQDVHSGGSGCGCSAVVLCGHIFAEMRKGTWNSVLFCGTGALHSPVSAAQGDSIPAVAHAVRFVRGETL